MPGPFIKWAGGKSQLLDAILPRLPGRIRTYREPFVGGGAVFFALARQRRFERAVLSDQNADLIGVYRVVRDDVEALIEHLAALAPRAKDPDTFYALRAQKTRDLAAVEQAARFIFLNKTCFNGLYRVNRKGQFNVPFGRYRNPKVLDTELLRSCSRALASVELKVQDFEESAKNAGPGDAVYFDPPYVPVSPTASFTAYHRDPFGPDAHDRLARVAEACWRRGAHALVSNSDCPFTRKLYARSRVETVQAGRAINRDPTRRGPVTELLVVGPERPAALERVSSAGSAA